MYKYVVIVLLFFVSNMTLAQNHGVEATNYSIWLSASDADFGNTRSISGDIRFPLYGYAGAELTGEFSDFNGKDNYIDSSANTGSLGLFLKKHDLGLIQVDYSRTRKEVDSALIDSRYFSDNYLLSGAYFFGDLNFIISRSKSKLDTGSTHYSSTIGLSYYLSSNLLIGASAFDNDINGKFVSISYQPELFGNSILINAGYMNDSDDDEAYVISLAYMFDLRVSLKDRVRRY